ncbi:CHAP domain-containing protein [Rhizobium ruizarguesonis]|uniref:CHAP domain-containing protein n=1 Tax=Rhizobium ruizarguesonis TaxID=2081791 RepID=UPI001038618B|nr:CHAP domain-containing protein [Rhizobium ruizarguesonis]TBB32449.1 CHAP domain-containing protein [Rhizobium ruizarguesonis]
MNRRDFIAISIASASTIGFTKQTEAQVNTSFDPVKDWGFRPIVPLDEPAAAAPTGTKPPRHGEIATAFRLLYSAPRNESPIGVARYFEGLPDKNEEGQKYSQEWPLNGRANPLIVGFFSSTFSVPSLGDQTSWCAAFLNFCLLVTGRQTTGSAQSGSFRNTVYYPETNNPSPGDIVVFTKTGPDGAKGFGHVAFYLADDGQTIELLGGNQVGSTGTTGAITKTRLKYKSDDLEFLSFRAVV